MIKKLSLLILCCFALQLNAQELNCDVKVTYANIKQTDPTVFKTLEDKIRSFLNETAWTEHKFQEEEKIDCSIYLNVIEEVSANRFKAIATIKSTRPVYNTSYNTVLLDIIDKDFDFEFDPYTELQYRENDFANNLTASLAFYAYTIIGLDYDSFSNGGGRQFHQKAKKIVETAATSPYAGWNQSKTNNSGDMSKFWINNNLTETKYTEFRTQFYLYHRRGLDQLYDEPKDAWNVMDRTIQAYKRFNKSNRNLPIMYVFFNAKSDEIVNVFGKAPSQQKIRVSQACEELDPVNSKQYRSLTK